MDLSCSRRFAAEGAASEPNRPAPRPADYRPPTVRRLGTLAELTRGGTAGPDDGLGGAGDDGSV
ncbi:lasso RiPP family leader peptide-containing protein [Micromonospora echinospora]|uniref:lasso RiPP family leader peptide-containing protein n=1 Tax=Micromonospora echinospora TaxID=1877 RepID=UPI0037992DCD